MKNIGKTLIFLICLYSAFFLAGGVFAPICAAAGEFEVSAKLTSLYMSSCHQAPDMSFWFLGFPFALCCRCLGFYLGVVLSGICSLLCKLKLSLRLFLILALIVIIDILMNFSFGIKNTGNIIRFIVGIIMGLLFVVSIKYLLERILCKND